MSDTESREMYLKSIFELEVDKEPVAVSLIAQRLGISSVSVSEMMKRLEGSELVEHTPYKGYALTEEGRKRAMAVVRNQRIWECFLAEHLNIPWEELYDYSCSLEHATHPKVTEALADFLGHPSHCPHGNPIPSAQGEYPKIPGQPLSELGLGHTVRISSISKPERTLCNYLADHGLVPGTVLTTIERAPYNGPLTVTLDDSEVAIGREIAARIFVSEDH